jgi:hypothetical protein
LSLADARAGVEALGKGFGCATGEGGEYYFPRDTAAAPAVGVLLLPNYDEYLVAYADRELMAGAGGSSPASAANLIFKNTVALRGEVVGTWQRTLGARGAKVALSPLAPFSTATGRAADRAVARYRAFLAGDGNTAKAVRPPAKGKRTT